MMETKIRFTDEASDAEILVLSLSSIARFIFLREKTDDTIDDELSSLGESSIHECPLFIYLSSKNLCGGTALEIARGCAGNAMTAGKGKGGYR